MDAALMDAKTGKQKRKAKKAAPKQAGQERSAEPAKK